MGQPELGNRGPLAEFLAEDHRRLDTLLQVALAHPGKVDEIVYGQFRAGLLRHIGMEEKILLPAVQRLRGAEPLSMAAKLRLDHGALAALLMPTPTAAILETIQDILAKHNASEEGAAGLYETCDAVVGPEAETIMAALRTAPEVTVMPYSDSAAVMQAVRRTLERAGYQLRERALQSTGGVTMTDQPSKPLNVLSLDAPLLTFDLRGLVQQIKNEPAWRKGERSTMPLFKTERMRVMLVALPAGMKLSSHQADGPITVQVIEGRIAFTAESQTVTLAEGQMLSLQAGLPHAVDAPEDAVFLLTVAPSQPAAPRP
ncbi:MAG TPA: hemerythrin domain-containing protein [Nitrospira sp.]|nr:hemerythrin domain-containing protein [Nitrospira sp.]